MKTYNNLYGMKKHMDFVFDKITKEDWDGLYLIVGDEGKSKSNLGLHITDYWYTKLQGKCTPEHVSRVAIDRKEYLEALRDSKRHDLVDYDEAGDISKKRAMSKWNVMLSQAYMVIRGRNMMSLLTLPDLFDLESFFTKRRAKGLFYVRKRGKFSYFSRKKLRKIISLNQNRIVKKINLVGPTFTDTFPRYKGPLLEPYMAKKEAKMNEITTNLYNDMLETDKKGNKIDRNKLSFDNLAHYVNTELGLSQRQIADIVGTMSHQAIGKRIREVENPLLANGN